jgi:predicted regulator of Ras-like GTPase activity (Roadblock/LC7/MglB family)
MRHVNVQGLRRRTDQRRVDLPKNAPQLFGEGENRFTVAPTFAVPEEQIAPEPVAPQLSVEEDEPTFHVAPRPSAIRPPTAAEPQRPLAMPAPAATGRLTLSLASLCQNWPEPVRSEALGMQGAEVSLPTDSIAASLSKGKVAFSWGQIHSWITPAANGSQIDPALELLLPLKVVAPAFMALSRPTQRKAMEVDDSIPTLFSGPAAPEPAAEELPEVEQEMAPAVNRLVMPADFAAPAPAPAIAAEPAPAAAPALKLVLSEAAEAPAAPVEPPAPVLELAPAPAAVVPMPAPEPEPAAAPTSVGELFGKPNQQQWTPKELVELTATLPGVSGAVLALQEGLQIAAKVPEGMKGDTVAAFLPQIFARLNVYAGEMTLSPVDDILMTTGTAHFQAYRIGQVYFAVLGTPGAALPWESLRLVVQELSAQAPV